MFPYLTLSHVYIQTFIRHRAARRQWSVPNALYHVPWFLSSFKGTQGGFLGWRAWNFPSIFSMHFLHALRGALGLDFGSHLASNLNQNSTRHRQKVPLKSTFGKTTLKVTPLSRKSMLSKLKNIAKTMEGHSKSHFSHVRNEVENTTLTPLILESFLDKKQYQNP